MGQVPSSQGLRLSLEGKRKVRKSSFDVSGSEIMSKTFKIQLTDRLIDLDLDLGLSATTGNLLAEFNKQYLSDDKVVAFRTAENIEILDFMLSIPNMRIKHLKEDEILIPVHEEVEPLIEGLDSYIPIKVIGKGGFSIVTLVRKKSSGHLYAVKSINKEYIISHRRVEHTLSERRILTRISHPFIISLHSSSQTVNFYID